MRGPRSQTNFALLSQAASAGGHHGPRGLAARTISAWARISFHEAADQTTNEIGITLGSRGRW